MYLRDWYKKNRQEVNAERSRSHKENPDPARERSRAWYAKNKERASVARRERWESKSEEQKNIVRLRLQDGKYRRAYGISLADAEAMFIGQGMACATCRTPLEPLSDPGSKRKAGRLVPVVDHCHKSGAVRGILCNHCNRAIGLLLDDPDRAFSVAEYLKRHQR